MSVSLKAMRYYCAALRFGSIARAAEELNVAASAVASAIDQIEAQFHLSLTIRQRARGIEATADGKVMAERFQALLDDYEAILRDGAERRQTLSGDLRVGYYAPVAPAFLPRIVSSLIAPDHSVTLYLDACDNRAAREGLRQGAYDAILFVADEVEPWMEVRPLIDVPPYCLVAASHAFADRTSLGLSDLAGERIVTLNRPFATDYYRAMFKAAAREPRKIAYCNSVEMVRSLVGAEGACAILNMLPLTDVSYAGDRLVAVPIRDPLPSLTLSLGYRSGPQRRAVTEFATRCERYFAEPEPLVCRAGHG